MSTQQALISFNGLVGIFVPMLVNLLIHEKASRIYKSLVGLLISVLVGLMTLIITYPTWNLESVSNNLWVYCVMATIITAQQSYNLYFKGKFNEKK